MQWLTQMFSRRRHYDDLAVSIQEHIAERAEELMESGVAKTEAEQAARREHPRARRFRAKYVTMV